MTVTVRSNITPKVLQSSLGQAVIKSAVNSRITKSGDTDKVVRSAVNPKVSNAKLNVGLDTSKFRWHKTPTPAVDGSQILFTLPDSEEYVSGLLEVFLDGIMQIKNTDYSETSSTTFTMVIPPAADEVFWINYIKV